ncbi:DUF979 domain-containing protein [uncultured Cardiobacterium sp.]|uniref:DUF979 domain-containing protein n=1 Tax=uncultured Cardiobacterium sp. TaxID=417619 RepID=UPI00262320C2|nr:DUF979 domain-containing protein [uncultured Cardiobacterium sp.]
MKEEIIPLLHLKSFITLDYVYIFCAIYLLIFGVLTIFDRKNPKRIGTALFWIIYAVTFYGCDHIANAFFHADIYAAARKAVAALALPLSQSGALLPGYMDAVFRQHVSAGEIAGWLVIFMAVIVAAKQLGKGDYREAAAEAKQAAAARLGNALFIPVLGVGVLTFFIAWQRITDLGALIGFGVAALLSLVLVWVITRGSPLQSFHEGRRLLDAIGWAAILSQLLAALGALFDKAGIGGIVSHIVAQVVPTHIGFAVAASYCIGMAFFTVIMGNAFAAFAVMTTGIGIPLAIQLHHANPLIVAPIAMLAGYCGTLMTPMAANFNIVPAALLEMDNKYGVIKAQIPVALLLLCANIFLMYFLGF